MRKKKVLFVCVHNSARSQMAEAYLKELAGDRFEAESAGFEPTTINPLAIAVMKEDGIDIADNQTQSVFDLFKAGRLYNYVITVCDESVAQQCPVFPGISSRLHWSFADPAAFTGTEAEKTDKARALRDAIKQTVREWLQHS